MTPSHRSERVGISSIFGVHGAVAGTFAARIPAISEHLHLTPGMLGIALFMPAVGSLSLMPFTGRLIHRVGGRAATRLLLAAWCLALALPAMAPNLLVLCVVLALFGAMGGTTDIAMNAQGSSLEQRAGRSIMSSLHGMWSVGGFVAAGIAALAALAGVGAVTHLTVMALVLLAVGQGACTLLAPPAPGELTSVETPKLGLPSPAVLGIGAIAFCAVFGEIGGADWSAVYMRRVLHSANATAAVAYTVFALAMAASRLTGDRVVNRFGATRTVRWSALAGVVGGVLIVATRVEVVTVIGFGLLGVGVAVVVPLAFAAAGRIGGEGSAPDEAGAPAQAGASAQAGAPSQAGAGNAIAGVATIAYGAGLGAPAAIGGIATLTSLPVAFAVVTALVGIVAVTARRVSAKSARSAAVAATV
jgi:MFS family permease